MDVAPTEAASMEAILSTTPSRRDYSLIGRDAKLAVENGLAAAEWYHTEVSRKQMKELMQRSDGPAIRDTIIWLGALVLSGAGGAWFWGTWWCVPFFFVYGVLYGSSTDSRWHECGHGTAFRTQWMNDVVYQIACFMIMRNPVTWRWSHTRHHTDTIIVGRDPEIAVMRPPDLLRVVLNFFGILDAWHAMSDMLRNAGGNHRPGGKDLHSRAGAAEGDPLRPHLDGDLCRDDRAGTLFELVPALDADRAAQALWRLASCHDRPAAAWRPRRQCHRSPPQQPHRLHEPDQPVHLLEHELPCGAPHVPDGALSRAAQAARD